MKNLKIAFRNLKRNPLLLLVNIPGLAVGLCVVLMLTVYLQHEFSFDRHFTTKDHVLRLYSTLIENGKREPTAIGLRDAYTQIPAQVPEIESATQIYRGWSTNVKRASCSYTSLELLYADPGFFNVFDLHLLEGNANTALKGKNKVVLSESTAKKVFGNDADVVGKDILISDETFMVSGIIKDLPTTTHFQFDLLASMETINPENYGGLEFFTYFLIDPKANLDEVGQKIAKANDVLLLPWGEDMSITSESHTELLSDIHLYTPVDFDLSAKVNLTGMYTVGIIAFFILMIALINFINLYILHGEKRIGEIGARKAIGADRMRLAQLFYTETGLIGIFAFVLAILLTILLEPYFAELIGRSLSWREMFSPVGIALLGSILLVVILLSGSYPSYVLSRINTITALRGKSGSAKRKNHLSVFSLVFQYGITAFLIFALLIIFKQISFLKQQPLGFTEENVIGVQGFNYQDLVTSATMIDEIGQLPFVEESGYSFHRMGRGVSGQVVRKYGDTDNFRSINEYRVNPGFCSTMKLQLSGGRYFDKSRSLEEEKDNVILNAAAVEMLDLKDPVGKLIDFNGGPAKVIGVVKDFYYNGYPGEDIQPLILSVNQWQTSVFYMRLKGDFTPDRQQQIADIFKSNIPDFVFSYYKLSEVYDQKFESDEQERNLVSAGTILAIIISFTGLMALSIFNVARRTKEICVRKVLGSKISEVMLILLKDTLIWVLIAVVIASIVGFWVMQQWLSHFTHHISMHIGYFVISGFMALIIALLAVSYQTWKAATQNPVEALRYE